MCALCRVRMVPRLRSSVILLLTLLVGPLDVKAAVPSVSSVTPQCGSINGGTRITVYGRNFARNFFNFGEGNEDLGSKVRLASLESYDTEIHPDGSHETQIMSYTEAMPEGTYTVRVSVDGEDVDENNYCSKEEDCEFTTSLDCTPTITQIKPVSGLPGAFIEIDGDIITTIYGSTEPDETLARIVRVYFGGQKCEARNLETDEFYGLTLDGNAGYIVCKTEGTYIGNHEISFIVDNEYGRSMPAGEIKHVRSGGVISMYQTFTDITGLSQSSGSTQGGTRLTVRGQHFDETDASIRVMVGDADCAVVEAITDTEIVCETPSETAGAGNATNFCGNRGFTVYVANGTSDAANLDRNAAEEVHVDQSKWEATDWGQHALQMVGYFQPPYSGTYEFCLKAASTAQVYMSDDDNPANKVQILSGSGSNCNTLSASKSLSSSSRYYVEIHYSSSSSNSFVTLVGRLHETTYSPLDTGQAEAEIQDLVFSSTTTLEVVDIAVTTPASVTSGQTQRVQELTISGNPDAYLAIGLHGAFTEPIKMSTLATTDLTAALSAVPSVPSGVGALTDLQGTDYVVTITSSDVFGDFEVRGVATTSGEVVVSSRVVTQGTADIDKYYLTMDNIPSPAIATDASRNTVKNAILELFSVRCHTTLTSGSFSVDFESDKDWTNNRDSNVEPFCGRYATRNPTYIYHKGTSEGSVGLTVSSSNNRYFCFAYKGAAGVSGVRVTFKVDDETARVWFNPSNDSPDEWVFHCEDILTKMSNAQSGSVFQLEHIQAFRQDGSEDLYVDQVLFLRSPFMEGKPIEGVQLMRMPQAQPNGAFIDDVSVTSASAGSYSVSITPYDCGYNFNMFKVEGASSSGTSHTLTNQAGEQTTVAITRNSTASPPILGTYKLAFDGAVSPDEIPVTVELDTDTIENHLSALGLGDTEVTSSGICSDFTYRVKMLDRTGNQPMLSFHDKSKLTGTSVTAEVSHVLDGSLWFDPIMGDLLCTHHDEPQVKVFVNNIPTRCEAEVCGYTYSPALTPAVTAISPTTGSNGDTVTITGTGFDAENTVILGTTPCNVTSATSTSIQCVLNNGPNGEARVNVFVAGKGKASGNVVFTFVTGVNALTPSTGSVQGGTVVSLAGFGFSPSAVVMVGDQQCEIVTNVESQIVCRTPAEANNQMGSTTTVDVEVIQHGQSSSAGTFVYDPSLTPVITAISSTTSNVWGGDELVIRGSGFGTSEMPVSLGGEAMVVESYNDTTIVAVLPALSHGSYPLIVDVDGQGYADRRTNSISSITYTFKVSSMSPSEGSLYGGTDLLITGVGFNTNASVMSVSVGTHDCDINSVTETQIECRITNTGRTHIISATGTHKNYGVGYAWNSDPHTVSVGDYVTWTWPTPHYVSDMAYAVHQTETINDVQNKDRGFSSGAKTRIGSYTHRFTTTGTYYLWTGYMDSGNSVYFRGTIHVQPLTSHIQTLSVQQMGQEAAYDTAAPTVNAPNACSPSGALAGCTDSTTLTPLPDVFNFRFLKCRSPSVTSISRANGTTDDTVTLRGQGFGTQNCQTTVKYAGASCTTTSSSASAVSFKVNAQDAPPIGVFDEFEAHVAGLGDAVVAIEADMDRRFALMPIIENITPFEGSRNGGTNVTITGAGFSDDPDDILIDLQFLECDILSSSFTEIVCTTNCLDTPSNCLQRTLSVDVFVMVNGNNLPVSCIANFCSFVTTDSRTATVTSVSPGSISGPTTLTISGSGFTSTTADLRVDIGGEDCAVTAATASQITCDIGNLPAGDNSVSVYVANDGKASATVKVTGEHVFTKTQPAASSQHGGALLVLDGNGFVEGQTSVTVGGAPCELMDVSLSGVTCILPAMAVNDYDIVVTSNSLSYPPVTMTYSTAATPSVTGISPSTGQTGASVTVTGTGFTSPASSQPNVTIGGAVCAVSAATDTSITCTLGTQETGSFGVLVFVEEKGRSNNDTTFDYEVGVFTVSPDTGTTNGGQVITLSGSGFLANSTVLICGQQCTEMSVTPSQYVCKTPSNSASTCDVVATVRDVSRTKAGAYTYDAGLVSTVTGVSPVRGGTGGGTLITITGTNFGNVQADVAVTIGGSVCTVQTVADTQITCRTGTATSMETEVEVQIDNSGIAVQVSAAYEYIDMWSSIYTWGGGPVPEEGDFVVIPEGQKILLDANTTVLKMLLIQGGHVIFDHDNVELQAENILITDGGSLTVGTESEPFPADYTATITLHGFLRSKELPIYGTKTLAVREGTLDLHGQPVSHTWTRLASTATAGSTSLVLEQSVDWKAGDEIVIATTGHRHSQGESEVHTIDSITSGTDITLREPLTYEHLGIDGTFAGVQVDFRAEVGLFTRNVVVRGYRNVQFDETIEACPDGFNTGEFATQTCFQGRFGEEMGSDQFGAQIMVHQPEKDTQIAQAHLSYVQLEHSGQAFRLGRYAIHFHLNGIMDQSYVRGCSIHTSFNRAVNVHGSHGTLVEHNIIYNVMGGAFFLEDGDETGSTFQYNLAIFVRSSTSLRNDDITPAAFWATNPNNTIRHNNVAGGTHFGTWYRMHTHPEGPGFDVNICPQSVPLTEFRNNSVHSNGWFGLWIFEIYVPRVDASCSDSADHEVAMFYSLTAWNCEKGAEGVDVGAVQFRDFILVNNEKAGYEGKKIIGNPPGYDEDIGPSVIGGVIVSHYDNNLPGSVGGNQGGIVLPYGQGLMIKDVDFVNFDQGTTAAIRWARIDGTCSTLCGGFSTVTEGLNWPNSPNRVNYAWESEGVLVDLDGTLASGAGKSIVPCTPSLDSTQCTSYAPASVGIDGCECSSQVKLGRFSWNNIVPDSMEGKDAVFATEFGVSNSPYALKRITHKHGWAFVFMFNHHYNFSFENAEQIANISFDSIMYGFEDGDFLIFTQFAEEKPDIFNLDGSTNQNMSSQQLSVANGCEHGDWFYSEPDRSVTYCIKHTARRKKRSVSGLASAVDININARILRCPWRGCVPPPGIMDVTALPTHTERWSDPSTWRNVTHDELPPVAGDDLLIPDHKFILVDVPIPRLAGLTIEGGLTFSENMSHVIECDYMYITGRVVAGWSQDEPFTGNLEIILHGSHSTPTVPSNGVPVGAKFIAAFGGLQLHGIEPAVTKTQLASTVQAGATTLQTSQATGWSVGDSILVTTTDYDAWHNEVVEIAAISGDTITVSPALAHKHIATTETIAGVDYRLAAEVALLSRNIKITGNEYANLASESFGPRVLVSQTSDSRGLHIGFGQISNVEFYKSGQEGFAENYDPRFSLSFVDVTSDPNELRYSYVRKSTFHHGFNTAIGVFGVTGLEVDGNVVYHTVNSGIRTEASGTRLTNNLVTLSIWPGAYQNRSEPFNIEFEGSIDGKMSTDLVLVNNSVYGSERIGYRLPNQPCTTADGDLWSGNLAVGCMIGVGSFQVDTMADDTCVAVSGYTLWKSTYFGFYYTHSPSYVLKKNVVIETGVGSFALIIGPSAVGHEVGDKYAQYIDNVFVGKTSTFDESTDFIDDTADENYRLAAQAVSSGKNPCGKSAVDMPTFSQGGNNSPEKKFQNIMSYGAIAGHTILTGNTFANYGSCTGGRDRIVQTMPGNEDFNHPMDFSSTTLDNVETDSLLFFHEPSLGKINPADCVDMNCDAKKKCFIKDLDGTFMGQTGTILPDSAFEWDGDRRYGLGDYRIPDVMLTSRDAQLIDVNDFAPHKGIFKTDNCTWNANWRAYKCGDNIDWRLLTIESMDADTESRRLSPVAVFHPAGYIDLINGPQDHGWCHGYTCQKRLSTFQAIIALDEPFDIFLASSNPKNMRYILMNSNSDDCVRLGMYYINQNRLDVYVDGVFRMPNNAYYDSQGRYKLSTQSTNHQWMPEVLNKSNGENYLSRAESMLFWTQCGDSKITVVTTEVVIVSFTLPAMTEEEFFGENIVENLAGFLNMDPAKVRVVNIVADTSSTGRRKRSQNVVTFDVEISDSPGTNQSTVNYDDVGQKLCDQAQLFGFDEILNATVLYTSILEPSDPGYVNGQSNQLQRVGNLVLHDHPNGNVKEGEFFQQQPKLKVADDQGDVVNYLGAYSSPWVVEVSILSGGSPRAQLSGNTTLTFEQGWANFTNLAISNKGDYLLRFDIISPAAAANYSLDSQAVRVFGKNLQPDYSVKTVNPLVDYPIEVEITLKDLDTSSTVTDIEWANLTWTATATFTETDIYSGALGGSTSASFDPVTGKATFNNLQLDTPGKCPVTITVVSDPADYTLTATAYLEVMTVNQSNIAVEKASVIEIKYDVTYDSSRAEIWAAQVRNQFSQLTNLRVIDNTYRQGSLIVSLSIEATMAGYNNTIDGLCADIENSTTITFDNVTVPMSPYMTVDGQTYYGVYCGPIPTSSGGGDDDDDLDTVYIVLIVVLSVMVLALVAILLAYKFYFHPKSKTSDLTRGHKSSNMRQDLLHDTLSRDDTFTSLKSRPLTPNMAPVGHELPSNKSFDLRIETPGRPASGGSPVPRVITPIPVNGPIVNDYTTTDRTSTPPRLVQPSWQS